jgi:hypothetical protein
LLVVVLGAVVGEFDTLEALLPLELLADDDDDGDGDAVVVVVVDTIVEEGSFTMNGGLMPPSYKLALKQDNGATDK